MARSTKKGNPARGKHCYLRGNTWWFDFKLQGEPSRRRGPLPGCSNKDEAEIAAGVLYKTATQVALGVIDPKQVKEKVTVEFLIARFWEDVASDYQQPASARGIGNRWIEFFGTTKLVNEITRADIVRFIKERKKGGYKIVSKGVVREGRKLADGTILQQVEHLKRALIKARQDWGYATPDVDQLSFGELEIAGGAKRHVRPWSVEKVEAFLAHVAAADPDVYRVVLLDFCQPLRKANAIGLLKTEIDWQIGKHGAIDVEVKSNRRSRKRKVFLLTAESAELIRSQWSNHPTHVFTFVAKVNRPAFGQRIGERYPFTVEGFRARWNAVREAYGAPQFRFHDIRHVVASLVRTLTKDVTVSRDLLGHSKVSTTEIYLGGELENAASGAEALSAARAAHRGGTTDPTGPALDARVAELRVELARLEALQLQQVPNLVRLPRRQAS